MTEHAATLVRQLRDFRTRKQAMDALALLGDQAVPPLVQALDQRAENVLWCIQKILADIATPAVTTQLIEALDDPARRDAAAAALEQVTGQAFGTDPARWNAWATGANRPAPQTTPSTPAPQPMSDKDLMQAAIAGTHIQIDEREGGFLLNVPVAGTRHQQVTATFAAKDFEDEPLVVIYTECGPAETRNFEWALRQNLRMSFGAIAIRDRDEQPVFVMVNTHTRSAASPEDIRKSVLLLARKGDALEEALTKADQH